MRLQDADRPGRTLDSGRHGWLDSRARQRMAAVATGASFFSLVIAGYDVVLPLWVTNDLQYNVE